MLKFKRGHSGEKVSYELFDGINTAVLYLNPGNLTISWNKHRNKIKLHGDNHTDIPELMRCIAACGLEITTADYDTIREMTNDAIDISAIKVAEMYCNKQ
jgi:hypothetical protein